MVVTLSCTGFGTGPGRGAAGQAQSFANAVADASGARLFELPITAERIYKALHGDK